MLIVKYEREFVHLNKYARELVTSEVDMCTNFEWGLNEDIRMLVGALELKEFIVSF